MCQTKWCQRSVYIVRNKRNLQIDFRACVVGAHVPFDLERHSSLSDARMETTRLRLSGLSGEATQYELPSPSVASVETASESIVIGSEPSIFGLSARTDIFRWWVSLFWLYLGRMPL